MKGWVQEMICSLVSAFNQFEIRFCFWGCPTCHLTPNPKCHGIWTMMPCVKPIGFLRIGFGLPFQGGFLTPIFQQFWICIPVFIASFHPSLVGGFADVWEVGAICLYFNILPKYMLSMFVLFYNLVSLFSPILSVLSWMHIASTMYAGSCT